MDSKTYLAFLLLAFVATLEGVTGRKNIKPKIPDNTTCEVDSCYADKLQEIEKKFEKMQMIIAMQTPPEVPTEDCPRTHFIFPRDNQQKDYIRYRRFVPELKAATICGFFFLEDLTYIVPIASYQTSTDANEILIEIQPQEGFLRLTINLTSYNEFYYIFRTETQYHICSWFDSKKQIMGVYINGEDIGVRSYDGSIVDGFGSLLVGQDEFIGGFMEDRSFRGTYDNFIIFPRVLTEVEVMRMAFQCQCPVDHVISMTLDKVEFSGETTYSVSTKCPIVSQ